MLCTSWFVEPHAYLDVIVKYGATITHHHAVGRDHQPWYVQELDPIFLRLLAAMKRAVDPRAMLNPGVLITPEMMKHATDDDDDGDVPTNVREQQAENRRARL